MTGWDTFSAELDRWNAAGKTATFWWRDDDAVTATSALSRLLDLQRGAAAPLALAVIPAMADDTLASALDDGDVSVLQHGFAHMNHAEEGAPKCEFGDARPNADAARDLRTGWDMLSALVGTRAQRVLAPPWNRVSGRVLADLPALGYRGVSLFKARRMAEAAPGLRCVNTHVDIIDWRGSRGFCGDATALAAATGHLAARRTGQADAVEPTGLLTHHLVHDPECWSFIERFARTINGHPAAQWLAAGTLFDDAP